MKYTALINVIARIRASLDLDTLFKVSASEIRILLNADRVGVFRFDPDSSWDDGEFVAEDVAADFPSAMAVKVHDRCFGNQFAVDYEQGHIQAVADIYNAGLSDCHIQILAQFHVRANLIVPLLKGSDLWGLLCIHQCANAREWEASEIEFVQHIASQFCVALQQVDYVEKIQQQTSLLIQAKAQEKAIARQKTLVKIANKIRCSFDLSAICRITTEEIRYLLEVDRVTVYRFNSDWSGEFMFESVGEGWRPLVGAFPTIEDTHFMETKGGRYARNETFAIADIYEAGHSDCHIKLLEEFSARAYAIASIFHENRLWGLLTAFQNSSPRSWETDEIQLLAQTGEQLGIALQQTEYIEKMQLQTLELEQALRELQQSQMQLVQNEKMTSLRQLVAGIAHEINNPINFIYGNINHINEYMQNVLALLSVYQQAYRQPTPAVQQKLQEVDIRFILQDLPKILLSMKLGSDRIRQIVLSLRNFSRLDESELKAVDIHEGIESTLLILGYQLTGGKKHRGIEVIKNYSELPLLKCFPAELNQAFLNLFSYTINAIEEAVKIDKLNVGQPIEYQLPKIWIHTRLNPDRQVQIRIRHNGIGISEKVKLQIFNYFFTTKPITHGEGLGLAIARQIITEKHHGNLILNSASDRGAELLVFLPINAI